MNKYALNFFAIVFLFSALFTLNVSKVKAEYLGNDKPLFVTISTDWCYACKLLHPVVQELKNQYTQILVTNNTKQAARVSERTAFFLMGELVEVGETQRIFTVPSDRRTEDYVSGRFG